jgi:hypothetical protein
MLAGYQLILIPAGTLILASFKFLESSRILVVRLNAGFGLVYGGYIDGYKIDMRPNGISATPIIIIVIIIIHPSWSASGC